jgi:hypothetical protein
LTQHSRLRRLSFANTITTASGAIAVVLAGTALAMAGTAAATPTGGTSAADTVKAFKTKAIPCS